MIRRLAREPLVHFAALGALLFAIYGFLAPGSEEASVIVVSSDRIASIAAQFQNVKQRPPTPAELDALVEAHVRDEIFYREGLALGLDRDDAVVRNRVKQKMEIANEDALTAEPSDAELQKYLDAHRKDFELPAALSFEQLYFDPERHGGELETKLRTALGTLRADAGAVVTGDLTQLPARLERALPNDIVAAFGVDFAAAVSELPVGEWSGPLSSSFGRHLVRVTAKTAKTVPSLSEARDVVLREWTRARSVEAKERLYRSLRERYSVTIERPLPAAAPAGAHS